VTDFMIRDIPNDLAASIDRRAKDLKLSRQTFLVQHLSNMFGPEGSATATIARRLKHIFDVLAATTFPFDLPRASLATTARLVGHDNPAQLEAMCAGEAPLPFSLAEKLCEQFGIYEEWLMNGRLFPFYQEARYFESEDCLNHLLKLAAQGQRPFDYEALYFVLSNSEPNGAAALYGYSSERPYRCDLILRGIPITRNVSGGGKQQIYDFGLLCAAIDKRLIAGLSPYVSWGRIVDNEHFKELTEGTRHPAEITSIGLPMYPWQQDFWDLEDQIEPYTKNFEFSKTIFHAYLADSMKITTNEQLLNQLNEKIELAGERFAIRTNGSQAQEK
jgi:hypothetical protein